LNASLRGCSPADCGRQLGLCWRPKRFQKHERKTQQTHRLYNRTDNAQGKKKRRRTLQHATGATGKPQRGGRNRGSGRADRRTDGIAKRRRKEWQRRAAMEEAHVWNGVPAMPAGRGATTVKDGRGGVRSAARRVRDGQRLRGGVAYASCPPPTQSRSTVHSRPPAPAPASRAGARTFRS